MSLKAACEREAQLLGCGREAEATGHEAEAFLQRNTSEKQSLGGGGGDFERNYAQSECSANSWGRHERNNRGGEERLQQAKL